MVEIGLAQQYGACGDQPGHDRGRFGGSIGEGGAPGGRRRPGNIDIVLDGERNAEQRHPFDEARIGRGRRVERASLVPDCAFARLRDPQRRIIPFGDARQHPVEHLGCRNLAAAKRGTQ